MPFGSALSDAGIQNSAYSLELSTDFKIRNMQKKRWKILESPDEKAILALADSLTISSVLAKLLIQRNITTFFEAKTFFRPSIEDIHDPYLMDGMEKAALRVIESVTNNERICVYGDYDVDGTCSASLLYMFLKELGANVEVYIPNRLDEGYGISVESIDLFRERNINLLISVDCGITAVREVEYASQFNIDTIICDHHQPKEKIPDAYAVLDPIKPGCSYPFKYLSGAGVAFKLARAVADRIGRSEDVFQYLDLVALAAAADIVPLLDENRILVKRGIELINSNPRPGIRALIKIARMEPGNLSAGRIVFTLAPRINAVGRMGDAMRAVDLFTAKTKVEAERTAAILEKENIARRKIDEMTFSHAIELLHEKVDIDNDMGIVLHNESWHPGVIGIVASRMVEKYHRPAVMLTTIDGVAKGSARSIPGFDIYSSIEACKDLLIQFGGHKAAAGLALKIENVDIFRKRFNESLKERLNSELILPEIKINAEISFSEITPKFIRILDQFSPYGPGNMRPVFLSRSVSLSAPPRIVGKNHMIATLRQNGNDKVFDSIGFNLGEFVNLIDYKNSLLDIVYTIEQISRGGKIFPQFRLKDIRVLEN